ncbi:MULTISPECIES: type II secretion system F family protein [Paraburkholderia]|jgi:tight adherence protein C|uniref:Tight adherence protein C n=1 Tax=Paraburkholderia phenazinium TaxID=60549 RepID=A0A1N6I3Q4_9BURK|nr:type II secretion system F family protein [Paraburkholderia phenazinium]SIO26664.1 tight adherence protein C [Paraburkholderia phenazinium]
MNTMQLMLLGATFVIVFGAALGAMIITRPNVLQRRLDAIGAGAAGLGERSTVAAGASGDERPQWKETIAKASAHVAKLSLPTEGWDKSVLRTRFMNAGWRSASAPAVYFAAKTVLALSLPLIALLMLSSLPGGISNSLLMVAALLMLLATLGYYLPNVVLSRQIDRRQQDIFENLPDALDLMTVCVEAGLGVDAAMLRVADEIHVKSQVMSDEFSLVLLELRAGSSREKALRNLAMRTGVADVETLVGMLVQAERFGTSVGAALRVHTDMLRTKRRHLAEERAAKVALKLLFPLMFFIFPALLIVLLGPAVIQIYRVMLPTVSGIGG